MGGSISQSTIVDQVNNMTAEVFTSVAMMCNTQALSFQTAIIHCKADTDGVTVYEAQSKCDDCMKGIVAFQKEYYDTQRRSWNTQPARVNKPIDSDFQNVIQAFVTCTSSGTCKACPISNVSQTNVIKSTIGCTAFTQIKNVLSQKLMVAVSQQLTNNQDMLSPLARLLGASDYNEVVQSCSNRISASISDNVVSDIQQQLESNQTLVINGNDSGMTVTGQTQSSALSVVQNYLSKTNALSNIFSQDEWKNLEELINDQTTVNSVGNAITKSVSYISKTLTSIVGKVVLFVLCLIGILAVGIVIYAITLAVRKSLKKQHDKDVQLKAQAEALPAFERF